MLGRVNRIYSQMMGVIQDVKAQQEHIAKDLETLQSEQGKARTSIEQKAQRIAELNAELERSTSEKEAARRVLLQREISELTAAKNAIEAQVTERALRIEGLQTELTSIRANLNNLRSHEIETQLARANQYLSAANAMTEVAAREASGDSRTIARRFGDFGRGALLAVPSIGASSLTASQLAGDESAAQEEAARNMAILVTLALIIPAAFGLDRRLERHLGVAGIESLTAVALTAMMMQLTGAERSFANFANTFLPFLMAVNAIGLVLAPIVRTLGSLASENSSFATRAGVYALQLAVMGLGVVGIAALTLGAIPGTEAPSVIATTNGPAFAVALVLRRLVTERLATFVAAYWSNNRAALAHARADSDDLVDVVGGSRRRTSSAELTSLTHSETGVRQRLLPPVGESRAAHATVESHVIERAGSDYVPVAARILRDCFANMAPEMAAAPLIDMEAGGAGGMRATDRFVIPAALHHELGLAVRELERELQRAEAASLFNTTRVVGDAGAGSRSHGHDFSHGTR